MLRFKQVAVGAIAAALLLPLTLATPAFANSPHKFNENFNMKFRENWFHRTFEELDGLSSITSGFCVTDTCASFKKDHAAKYLSFVVYPTTTEGFYTGTDLSEVELGLPTSVESGQWNPSPNKPVIMEARVRWGESYNIDGSGDARGTSGIILWNSAIGPNGPEPTYDQLGFTWSRDTILGGYLAGLTAGSLIDLMPVNVIRPTEVVDIHDWVDLKLVWSVDAAGQQSAEYFINDESLGSEQLPVALHNLSAEIWNDNQEPQFTENGIETFFAAPVTAQNFDIDKLTITQRAN